MSNTKQQLKCPNALVVADMLRGLKDSQFDMSEWYTESCDTVGCIGGWMQYKLGIYDEDVNEYLGLPSDFETLELFCMANSVYGYSHVTKAIAIAHLESIAKTGKVDWDAAIEGRL